MFKLCSFLTVLICAAKPLAAGSETIEDLRRLALIFGNVERLLHLAAFLHRKFFLARSLSDAIFSEFFKHSTRRMGTGFMEEIDDSVILP